MLQKTARYTVWNLNSEIRIKITFGTDFGTDVCFTSVTVAQSTWLQNVQTPSTKYKFTAKKSCSLKITLYSVLKPKITTAVGELSLWTFFMNITWTELHDRKIRVQAIAGYEVSVISDIADLWLVSISYMYITVSEAVLIDSYQPLTLDEAA